MIGTVWLVVMIVAVHHVLFVSPVLPAWLRDVWLDWTLMALLGALTCRLVVVMGTWNTAKVRPETIEIERRVLGLVVHREEPARERAVLMLCPVCQHGAAPYVGSRSERSLAAILVLPSSAVVLAVHKDETAVSDAARACANEWRVRLVRCEGLISAPCFASLVPLRRARATAWKF
jgi:hypothetical protein